MWIYWHASRHGSRHATAWGVLTFLAAGITVPVYFIHYFLDQAALLTWPGPPASDAARRGRPQPLPPPLPPEERSVGQLVAETIRFYQHHFFQTLALGLSVAALTPA